MKVNVLSSDVYEIEDFVTVDQQQQILQYAKSLEEKEWWSDDEKVPGFFTGKIYIGEKPEVFSEIDEKVKSLFSNFYIINPISLHRHLKTHYMWPHQDYDPDNQYYNKDNAPAEVVVKPKYGVVIYYNDDYDGGAVNYPNLGLVHKPKARSLVMHGGEILHGTTQVTNDVVRYFSTTFILATKEKGVVFNKDIFGDIEPSNQYVFF